MSREEHSISAKEPQKTRKSAGKESCISTHGNGYPAYDRLAATGIYAKESYLSAKELCISIKEPYISAKKLYVSEKEICMSAAEPYMSDLLPPPCNTQQHTSTNRNTLQYTATHCNTTCMTTCRNSARIVSHRWCNIALVSLVTQKHTAARSTTHCNILQHAATHCNTLQTLQHTSYDKVPQQRKNCLPQAVQHRCFVSLATQHTLCRPSR